MVKKIKITPIFIFLLFFLSYFISDFAVCSENTLEIIGPADAFENEEVKFTVTLNGEPVQARVSFGDDLYELYSNSTTGIVKFITPIVAYNDQYFTITASYLGELIAYHLLLVKNNTDMLKIELSTEYIIETEEFTVAILDREEPVVDASVWFNSNIYHTNNYGKVKIFAPDVLVTTYYSLSANKTGYKSTSLMITINNDNQGELLMDVIYPFIVDSNQDNIKITAIGENGGINDVEMDVYYEDEKLDSYLTDNDGNVFIKAPKINNDNYFSLLVKKDGYRTYFSKEQFIISLFVRDFNFDLDLSIDSSELYEGEYITLEVTNDIGIGVEGASIWSGSELLKETTDSQGYLTFKAPSVFLDREYYLYAVKEGYNYASKTITIRDRIENQKNLIINSVNQVNESEIFNVFIKDNNNILLPDVLVTFNSEQKLTNGHGMVDFIAPNISSNSFFKIEAVKSGYQPASYSIAILHNHDENCTNYTILKICVEPFILENNQFMVTIRDDKNFLISDALVTFRGTSLKTNQYGEVVFVAPDVIWDETVKISVTKTGFNSTSSEIIIKNIEGFSYWYLVIIVIIIFTIGLFAFLRFRYII